MITTDDLTDILSNPALVQNLIIKNIEENLNTGAGTISDPTNPVVMLLESNCLLTSTAIQKMEILARSVHPSLAKYDDELFDHVSDGDISMLLATPVEGEFYMLLNLLDIRNDGYRPLGAKYTEIMLPEHSVISAKGLNFTLMNDIIIRVYDNDKIFVEQLISDSKIAMNNYGVINSNTTTDRDDVRWIFFTINARQMTKHTIKEQIIVGDAFVKTVELDNKQFYTAEIYNINNNVRTPLDITFNDKLIDPIKPTVFIRITDTKVIINIPPIYIFNNAIRGLVEINVFTTEGKINVPLNKYQATDFTLTLGNTEKTLSATAMSGITSMLYGVSHLDGGKDRLTITDIKNNIINNTTGNNNTPITEHDITLIGSKDGFTIYKAKDIITSRVFVANKSIDTVSDSEDNARPSLFINKTLIELTNVENYPTLKTGPGYFIINPETIFKTENGITKLIDITEIATLNAMDAETLSEHIKTNNLFYTPFHYVSDSNNGVGDVRTYVLNRPEIINKLLKQKNYSLAASINLNQYIIQYTATGYKIIFSILDSDEHETLNKALLGAQLIFNIPDTLDTLHFDGVFTSDYTTVTFTISSDFYVTSEDRLKILNGNSKISDKEIDIRTLASIIIYSTDESISGDNLPIGSELYNVSNNYMIFTKEEVDIKFGMRLEYLWRDSYATTKEKYYKRYSEDVMGYYTEDIYSYTYDDIIDIEVTDDGMINDVARYKKGDPILDADGNHIVKHYKGDVMLDDEGKPIIDEFVSMSKYIDILMIEYPFLRANNAFHIDFMEKVISTIIQWLTVSITELNDKLLENTKLLFKPFRTMDNNIKAYINNTINVIPNIVRPKVIVYMEYVVRDIREREAMKNTIGKLLHNGLNSKIININNIREDIKNALSDSIVSVKIEGLDNISNVEIIEIIDDDNKLLLGKTIEIDDNGKLISKYDITLEIVEI
jgi:hypothetical protein